MHTPTWFIARLVRGTRRALCRSSLAAPGCYSSPPSDPNERIDQQPLPHAAEIALIVVADSAENLMADATDARQRHRLQPEVGSESAPTH